MFKNYISKPIVRKAYCITIVDDVEPLDNSTSILNRGIDDVVFKHYESVEVGDYIVYLNDDDIYHCNAKVFAEHNIIPEGA